MKLTVDQLKQMGVREDRAVRFVDAINDTLGRYEVDTTLRVQHWLAQVLHESGRLFYVEEIASGAAYEGRRDLGNTQPGDGMRFKGRGLIQLTGRANYTAYARDAGMTSAEALAEQLKTDVYLQTDVAGWFWKRKNLNPMADADQIKPITKAINGGYNGLDDRQRLLDLARRVVKDVPADHRVDVVPRPPAAPPVGLPGPQAPATLNPPVSPSVLPPDDLPGTPPPPAMP